MADNPTAPEWLVPGAPVVLYSEGGTSSSRGVQTSRVVKVAKQSFTVESEPHRRFRIDTCSSRGPGTWDATRYVVPLDSDRARTELEGARRRLLASKARNAVDEWLSKRTRTTRLAAIAALQAVED